MGDFFGQRGQLLVLVFFWVATTLFLGPMIYLVLPLSAFYLRSRELWIDLLVGFLMVLILSDMDPGLVPFRAIKSAKYGMMIAVSVIYFSETARFAPEAGISKYFLPFLIYAFFPLVKSSEAVEGFAKTASYALLYMVLPNYWLYCFRRYGWTLFRHYFIFISVMLVGAYFLRFVQPWWVILAGRYHGLFGNPNGLGIFSFLNFMLFSVCLYLNKEMFSIRGKIVVYAVLAWSLYAAGSRTAIAATGMFFAFSRVFALSPFVGLLAFLAFVTSLEYAQSHLVQIIDALGLQKYFRVDTIEDGSGRYFAWAFAWQKINEEGFFLTGGGFGNDEYVMRHNYDFLRSQGHDGGVHNSYLTMWFNTGILGILLYFYGFFSAFIAANKKAPIAFAAMFAVLFSVLYESWLTGSLNPYSIVLLGILTMLTEDDIVLWRQKKEEREMAEAGLLDEQPVAVEVPRLILPAK